jgi:hypothetical protein
MRVEARCGFGFDFDFGVGVGFSAPRSGERRTRFFAERRERRGAGMRGGGRAFMEAQLESRSARMRRDSADHEGGPRAAMLPAARSVRGP